jgi:hypothetical protein
MNEGSLRVVRVKDRESHECRFVVLRKRESAKGDGERVTGAGGSSGRFGS